MTPEEIVAYLVERGLSVAVGTDDRGQHDMLLVVGPEKAMTQTLHARLLANKAALIAHLKARHPPVSEDYAVPEVSMYRRWVPGATAGQFGTFKLEIPKYHDTPRAPVTYWGELCRKKTCQKHAPGATRSLRYFPSEMCVSCWERADKTTPQEKVAT